MINTLNSLGKYVKPAILAEHLKSGSLSEIDFKTTGNQLDDRELVIGLLTQQKVRQLLHDGDISPNQHSTFFAAVRAFFVRATEYMLQWFPLQDELLLNATWIDFDQRLNKTFLAVEYFVNRYPSIFTDTNNDLLNEQFINYQLLTTEDIPLHVRESADPNKEGNYCADILWSYIS